VYSGAKSGTAGLIALAVLLLRGAALQPEPSFWVNLVGKYLCFAFAALGLVLLVGQGGRAQPGTGSFLRTRGLLHGHVSQARSLGSCQHQNSIHTRASRFHGLEPDHPFASVLGAVQTACPFSLFAVVALPGAGRLPLWVWPCLNGAWAASISPSSPRRWR
jgi:ABC-type branched-subunit amino acid transport system permease subunit